VLLDYGLAGTLSTKDRRSLLLIALALRTGDSARLKKLSEENLLTHESQQTLKQAKLNLVISQALKKNSGIGEFIEMLIENEFSVRDEMVAFKRGLMFIDQLLRSTNKNTTLKKTMSDIAETMLRHDTSLRFKSFNRKTATPLTASDYIEVMASAAAAANRTYQNIRCEGLFH
jgi:predicted unusual protein kinase regulating ubiquinone biosynthesis (AarF/ABC1/UbiB family)